MNRISFLLLGLFLAASLHAGIPTPDSAMTFWATRDDRGWAPQFQDADKNGFIMEFVPKGDSIKAWKEMVAHQIAFTKVPARKYVDTWKAMLFKADPKVEIKEETMADESILVTYTSPKAKETSMRRFVKGTDGIYMIAYHVRPELKKDEIFKLWEGIIRDAKLVPNPEKKKK